MDCDQVSSVSISFKYGDAQWRNKKRGRVKGKRATAGKGKNRHMGSLESIGERDRDGIVMNDAGFHSLL